MKRFGFILIFVFVFGLVLPGCSPIYPEAVSGQVPVVNESTSTPFQPQVPANLRLWISSELPLAFRDALAIPGGIDPAESADTADLTLGVVDSLEQGQAEWIYALAAPFPTVQDEVTSEELFKAWNGAAEDFLNGQPFLVSAETQAAFSAAWGNPAQQTVQIVNDADLLDTAWQLRAFAIIPFESIEPRWKVIHVDGLSPLERDFESEEYPLKVYFGLSGSETALKQAADLSSPLQYPLLNRDPEKMTVLMMTGVTALVRATAAKMDEFGMDYPAEKIMSWLTDADLTHISNEVSFDETCPPGNPYQYSLQFCSRPEYADLLDDVGMDIMELSGNHLMDWGRNAFDSSLEMYKDRGWKVYAAGENLAEARQPLLIEDHGNKLAFLGCNPAGPDFVWATENSSGVADCDYEWMASEIAQLRQEGYLPIVTLQYNESYSFEPGPLQERDFTALSEAGAVIVSGSQAHFPQAMSFTDGNRFIHYGLGNLFFDQMRMPDGYGTPVFDEDNLAVAGTRLEFLDRHVFYDGQYINTELLTAMLEDYAQPRPLTDEEREVLLRDAFEGSGW